MPTNEELIRQMYDSNHASQVAQLEQDYKNADSEYADAKKKNAQITDQNLTRVAVDGQKAAMNMAQLHDAQGLSSGARSQARLSLENQTMANMTALRAAQQQSDADIERQRALLAQEYSSAIAKAEADNDLQKAEALYEAAKAEEERLLNTKLAAAKLMAEAGDYSMLGQLYGLTDEQVQKLTGAYWGTNGNETPDETPDEETGNDVTTNTLYPQQQPDGSFLVEGKAMTVDELRNAVAEGAIIAKQDTNGTWTFYRSHSGTPQFANSSFGHLPEQNAKL